MDANVQTYIKILNVFGTIEFTWVSYNAHGTSTHCMVPYAFCVCTYMYPNIYVANHVPYQVLSTPLSLVYTEIRPDFNCVPGPRMDSETGRL